MFPPFSPCSSSKNPVWMRLTEAVAPRVTMTHRRPQAPQTVCTATVTVAPPRSHPPAAERLWGPASPPCVLTLVSYRQADRRGACSHLVLICNFLIKSEFGQLIF